jgi:hypothetical protein
MELSCPNCGCRIDVPEKAFLTWKRSCHECGVVLCVSAVERRISANDPPYLAFELHLAEETNSPGGLLAPRPVTRQSEQL